MNKILLTLLCIPLLFARDARAEDHSAFFSRVLAFAAAPPAPFQAVPDAMKFRFSSGKAVPVMIERFFNRGAEVQVLTEIQANPHSLFLPKPLDPVLRTFFLKANVFSVAALSPEKLVWVRSSSDLDEDCMNVRSCNRKMAREQSIRYIAFALAISSERLHGLKYEMTYDTVEILTFQNGATFFDAVTDKDRVVLGVYPYQEIKFKKPELACTGYGDAPPRTEVNESGPSIPACCPGLVRLKPKYMFKADCTDRDYLGGVPLCLACGNASCDIQYENYCNCPQDCK